MVPAARPETNLQIANNFSMNDPRRYERQLTVCIFQAFPSPLLQSQLQGSVTLKLFQSAIYEFHVFITSCRIMDLPSLSLNIQLIEKPQTKNIDPMHKWLQFRILLYAFKLLLAQLTSFESENSF